MTRPSFSSAAMTALLLAALAAAGHAALVPLFSAAAALHWLLSGLALAYLLVLLRGGRRGVGRATAIACWLLAAGVCWFAAPGPGICLLMQAVLIWIVRSFLYHGGVLPALIDLAVCIAGAGAALWVAGYTGSVFLAAWCFFLCQALFVAIPARMPRGPRANGKTARGNEVFEQARRRAEAAFGQLLARKAR